MLLITIDVGQTMYAFAYYGSRFVEGNPLGFPLGVGFVLCVWFAICVLNEFFPKIRFYLFFVLTMLSTNAVFAVVRNFIVLSQA
jgi:hypothetical protein